MDQKRPINISIPEQRQGVLRGLATPLLEGAKERRERREMGERGERGEREEGLGT